MQEQHKKMLDGGVMHRGNWLIVFAGLLIFTIGFVALAMVGKAYHGFSGFFAPFLLLGGLVLIAFGFIYHKPDSASR